ncbi:hypothetical protein [Ferruginivarius sediminum]|nr:hypothetical protein [Ferruginivarius sediminum]
MSERDPFFRYYFERVDPEVAASFTPAQRRAIKLMFGARARAKHDIDVRRSIGLLGRRYYFVLLGGVERRDKERLQREGMVSSLLDAAVSLIGLAAMLLPVVIVVYFLKSSLGVDLISDGGVHGLMDEVGEQIRTSMR